MKTRTYAIVMVVLACAMLAGFLTVIGNTPQVSAAPAAAPTPVVTGYSPKPTSELTWLSKVATTASGGSTALNVAGWQATDIQYIIDQGTTNTVTLKLQFSNDGTNWTDGATIATNNAADAADLSQQAVFGKFARIYATVVNTNPVTVTVIGVMK